MRNTVTPTKYALAQLMTMASGAVFGAGIAAFAIKGSWMALAILLIALSALMAAAFRSERRWFNTYVLRLPKE